jgi:hypothetical protein
MPPVSTKNYGRGVFPCSHCRGEYLWLAILFAGTGIHTVPLGLGKRRSNHVIGMDTCGPDALVRAWELSCEELSAVGCEQDVHKIHNIARILWNPRGHSNQSG